MPPVLVWFRRNLRLRDNAPFAEAVASGRPVIPVYISDALDQGGASRWWLHHSLESLDRSLDAQGASLVVRQGDPAEVLHELVGETGAAAIYFTRRYEPEARQQERRIESELSDRVDIEPFDDSLLNHPSTVLTKSATPFKVFTPFWRAASARGEPSTPDGLPENVIFADHDLQPMRVQDLGLLPTAPDWSDSIAASWTPGEESALQRLDSIDAAVAGYADQRDRPDLDATSRLSPHLHFGEVGVRQVWHGIRAIQARNASASGAEALLRQLYWRDFSTYLLFHFPDLPQW